MKRKTMHDLPVEITDAVLGCLGVRDVCAARQVCRSFSISCAFWRSVSLSASNTKAVDSVLKTCRPTFVRRLVLYISERAGGDLDKLVSFSNVSHLSLIHFDERAFPLHLLASFQKLEVLKLGYSPHDADEFALLQALNLRKLSLSRPVSTGLRHIASCSSLTCLKLRLPITDTDLAHLGALVCLERFVSDNCCHLTDLGLSSLTSFTRLHTLNMLECHRITEAGLAHIGKLTSLTELLLWQTQATSIETLAPLTNLTSLNMYLNEKLTDAGLSALSRLTSLTKLNLQECNDITSATIDHLRALPLADLNLSRTNVGDLSKLSNITTLTRLDLSFNDQIRNCDLAHLFDLVNLQFVNLACCEGLTAAMFDEVPLLSQLKCVQGLK